MSRATSILLAVSISDLLGIGFLLMRAPFNQHSLTCDNHLRSIGMAFHNHHAQFGPLPPRVTRKAQREPSQSWRTRLEPFLGERDLFRRIDLTKLWNSINADTMAQGVSVYQSPAASDSASTCHDLTIEDPDSLLDEHRGHPPCLRSSNFEYKSCGTQPPPPDPLNPATY